MDTGLAAYLCGWYMRETLMNGASSGKFYETFVITEIIKSYYNQGIKPNIYYHRDTNKVEVDLLILENNTIYPIEIKKTASPNLKDIKSFKNLNGAIKNIRVGTGGLICNAKDFMRFDKNNYIIPIEYI